MKELQGSWKLDALEYFIGNRQIYPLGLHPAGRLVYSSSGYLSAILTKTARKPMGFLADHFHTREISMGRKLTGFLRYMQATTGCISYSGRYICAGNRVIHHIDIASYPDLEGTQLIRLFRIEGDYLILEAQDTPESFGCLIWQRECAGDMI